MTTNIWTSVEAAAWAKDLNYEGYLALYNVEKMQYTPFSEEEYETLYNVFETNMKRGLGSISIEEYDAIN